MDRGHSSGLADPYVGAIDLRDLARSCHPHVRGQVGLQALLRRKIENVDLCQQRIATSLNFLSAFNRGEAAIN
jgi:hypothetical protein